MLGMQEASMKLTESLHEVYEPDWYGREDVKMVGEVRAGHRAREAQRGFPAGPTMSYSLTSWPSLHFMALIRRGHHVPRRCCAVPPSRLIQTIVRSEHDDKTAWEAVR